ncbi:MAG: DUF932 domain-containing protein, partial [Verrucomicrobia bacterium]|nr:DUF932 domain-containing protein [Verrucomicrobiota bacterium]
MSTRTSKLDWLFGVDEAPVYATVTHKGVVRELRLPHKKALVAGDTGEVVGIVGSGYKVFTNQEAVELGFRFCHEAFPDTKPAEWTFVEGHGPRKRSWVAMDIHHQAHAMNLMGSRGKISELYTPFVRITNSYNGTRAVRLDVGFLRKHCDNGMIFEEEAATLRVPHTRRGILSLQLVKPFAGMTALR